MLHKKTGGEIVTLLFCKVDVEVHAIAGAEHDTALRVAGRAGVHPVERWRKRHPEVEAGSLARILDKGRGRSPSFLLRSFLRVSRAEDGKHHYHGYEN